MTVQERPRTITAGSRPLGAPPRPQSERAPVLRSAPGWGRAVAKLSELGSRLAPPLAPKADAGARPAPVRGLARALFPAAAGRGLRRFYVLSFVVLVALPALATGF